MIIANNLRKKYAPKKGVVVNALDDVSLKLPDTGMVFILGKSGSGKSTLLNVLGGLDSFDSGEIIINGQSTIDFKQSHYDSYRNTYVGFIFQEYNILEDFTVGANIALAIELQGRKATNQEIDQILAEVGLSGLGARKPNELSGGQKQRVAIARALVKRPEIIMADEPTGALDSITGRQVFDTLKELSKTKLVLIVSHDREFSELYADRIIELADGKIISDVEYDKEATESADEPNLSFSGKEIAIKDGYELTPEDIVSINQYIKKVKSGATLVVSDNRREKIFKPTNQNAIVQKISSAFKLIKSKLSIKNAFTLGSSGLKHKPVRLVFTIFLSFIAFSLFGLADTIASYDNINTCTNSIVDSSIDYVSFSKVVNRQYGDEWSWDKWNKYYLSANDIENIKQSTNLDYITVLGGDGFNLDYTTQLGSSSGNSEYKWENIFPDRLSGLVSVTKNQLDGFGYQIVAGSLPTADNQVAIPRYIAEFFVKKGYVEIDKDGNTSLVQINSVNELVGKKIRVNVSYAFGESTEFTIAGIVDTGFDLARYESLADTKNEFDLFAMTLQNELESAQSYSLHSVMFVTPKFLEDTAVQVRSQRSNVRDGYFELKRYKSDEIDLDSDENYIYSNSYYSLKKLSGVASDKIVWLGSPVTSLERNQVILPMYQISNFLNSYYDGSNKEEEVDFYSIPLTGVELKYANRFGGGSFGEIENSLVRIAGFAFAMDPANRDAIANAFEAMYEELNWGDFNIDEYYDSVENVFDSERFAENFLNNIFGTKWCPSGFNTNHLKAYYSQMLARYPQIKDHLVSGDEFASYLYLHSDGSYSLISSYVRKQYVKNDFANIIIRKFASTHFANEYANAKVNLAKPEWYEEGSEQISFSRYCDSLYPLTYGNRDNYNFSDEFVNEFDAMYTEAFISNYKEEIDSMLIAMNCYSYYKEDPNASWEKNIKVVGISRLLGDHIIVADSIYTTLVDEISDGEYVCAVAPMPTDRASIKELVTFSYSNSFYDNRVMFSLKNSVTQMLGEVDEILDTLGQVFLYVGLAFALFAALMLSNFIATSISYKKQEIGILRAIGSRSLDVFMIFFAESFIIAMINFGLSVVTTGVASFFINNMLREEAGILITFLSFGIRQIALILGVSLLVALIATFLPVKKIASMKPIDAIKNRK